eukprot:5924751-Alexandrium_andersonii.AAC.1
MITEYPRQWKNIVKQAASAIDQIIWTRHSRGCVLGAASPRPPKQTPVVAQGPAGDQLQCHTCTVCSREFATLKALRMHQ